MLEVLQAGPLTLVQDLGRPGSRHLGIPAGGAMDPLALQQANALLGNPPGAAALELVAGPLRLRPRRDVWLALRGADFEVRIDGRVQPEGLRLRALAGELVELRGPRQGQYALLAFDGGIVVPEVLGARATALRGGFGGWEGRALRAGDLLPLGEARTLKGRLGLRPEPWAPLLRALPGPELGLLRAAAQSAFWRSDWALSPHSDRMGLRLQGPLLPAVGVEPLSHAVLPGLVQLPPGGQPIVLGADAQTTGGYPRLAQVVAADLWKLARLRPGELIRFQPVDLDTARRLQAEQAAALRRLRKDLGVD
jgi:biotin-dependent carboxylase-like uncharacterized protein